MKTKQKKDKSIILRLLVLGVCAYMILTLINLYNTLGDKMSQRDELKTTRANMENDVDELKSLLNSDSDSKIIEKAARERLGYVFPDEQIFIDISGS